MYVAKERSAGSDVYVIEFFVTNMRVIGRFVAADI